MTEKEAISIIEEYHNTSNPSKEDDFMYTEALGYLIETENNPNAMMELGGYYYELKKFDLALKYYEMAESYDLDDADTCLGYIWYYGRTGERDYEKAFHYYEKSMNRGNVVSAYKIADMYKNGYFVEKDYDKYVSIIESLYPKVKKTRKLFDPVPEIYTRLARIRKYQGKTEEAVELYLYAKDFLAQRISYNAFFGNLNIMKWLVDDLYELIEFDEDEFEFFDLYYLLKTPHTIYFEYNGEEHTLESVMEDGNVVVHFDDVWYRDRDDFFAKATIEDNRLTSIYRDLYGFYVE